MLWQFQMDGPYSNVRPAIGPDGTVYAIDVYGTLYALAPDGALRWRVDGAGNKGLAVGPDGTVYVASEGLVRAFGADGAARWTYTQSPRAFILVGLAVGPDGNLYAVASLGQGVFSLTPGGALRWSTPEEYLQPIIAYGEIVFGPGSAGPQLYFYANHHVRALGLDGRSVFTLDTGGQPVISPLDGSVHLTGGVYGPDGALRWLTGLGSADTPAVGPDGTHYATLLAASLHALDPAGQQRWQVTSPSWIGTPTVDPAGTRVVLAASDPSTFAASLQARSTADGALLWSLALPSPGGRDQFVDTPVRFTADGATAYLVTNELGVGARSYVTAVAAR